ncbi:MAG: hypothetical protein R2701_01215 [Acidimicrobiales bacterium]
MDLSASPSPFPMPSGPAARIAQWTLYGVFAAMVLSLYRTRFSRAQMRKVGGAWDILSFWPRGFHPFAVRPYTTCAVAQLRELVFTDSLVPAGEPITVVAHSQGTILAVAALASGGGATPDRPGLRLVTVGSPLRALYQSAYPRYFDDALVDVLDATLGSDGAWINAFRFTDGIGRTVFGEEAAFGAVERDKPSAAVEDPAGAWSIRPLEGSHPAKRPRRVDLALADPATTQAPVQGHNDYWEDPRVRAVVREWRAPDVAAR